jgi:hypothetical protein
MSLYYPSISRRVKIITITHKAPVETLQTTPTSLPTAKPVSPQKSYTVASTDLPTTDVVPDKIQYQAMVFVAGKNTDTVSQTVYIEVYLNGTLVRSASSTVGAGYYWTASIWVADVKVGDVIDVYIWASDTAVNWDYDAYQIQVMNIVPISNNLIATLAFNTTHYPLTRGTPSTVGAYGYDIINFDVVIIASNVLSGSAVLTFPINKHIFAYIPDLYGSYLILDASITYRPYYRKQYLINTVKVLY